MTPAHHHNASVRGPSKHRLHAHVCQSTHKSPYLFRNRAEGSAVRPGKGRDWTDAGGHKLSLPFTTSRILGVIGSQSSHWSGRLIRVPDKDKDKDVEVVLHLSVLSTLLTERVSVLYYTPVVVLPHM